MIRFVIIGHVDSGKSSLCGQILLKCGYINEREFEKIKVQADKDGMSKWAFSRILDINVEEQEKGKTREFNFVDFEYKNKNFRLIDTPGHHIYITSMIEGLTSGADVVLILVSMQDKEWRAGLESGVLKEQIKLAKGIGIRNAIIVANKMDLIGWDKKICFERIRIIKNYCIEVGFNENNIKAVPISAWHGVGLTDLHDVADWYTNDCLMDIISKCKLEHKNTNNVKTKEILIEIKSDYPGIITKGFTGITYSNLFSDVNFEVVNVKSNIIRTNDIGQCWIKFENDIIIENDMDIILRSTHGMIGIGKIKKIRSIA